MPARSVHIPAVPAAVTAEAEESFTITFAMPFAEPTSFTGFDLSVVAEGQFMEVTGQIYYSNSRCGTNLVSLG